MNRRERIDAVFIAMKAALQALGERIGAPPFPDSASKDEEVVWVTDCMAQINSQLRDADRFQTITTLLYEERELVLDLLTVGPDAYRKGIDLATDDRCLEEMKAAGDGRVLMSTIEKLTAWRSNAEA